MQFLRVFCLFVLLFLSSVAHAQGLPHFHPAKPLSQTEVLKNWGNRHKDFLGTLVTPPTGVWSEQARTIHTLVNEILDKLDPSFRVKHQLVVQVYAGHTPNAFVQNVQVPFVGDNSLAQDDEKIVTPPRPTPYHDLLKLDYKKPVYELGVSVGLIQLVKNEDELAFVLAHEIQHILEGHTEGVHKERNQKEMLEQWWAGQRHEAVADHLGLKLMVGKYELSAAVSVMWRLANEQLVKEKKDSEWSVINGIQDSLSSAASTHHDSGVRLSLLQGEVEYLRRSQKNASYREFTLLPGGIEARHNARSPVPVTSSQNLQAALNIRKKIFDRELIEKAFLPFVSGTQMLEADYYQGVAKPDYNVLYLDAGLLLTTGLVELADSYSGATNQQKFETILNYVFSLQGSFVNIASGSGDKQTNKQIVESKISYQAVKALTEIFSRGGVSIEGVIDKINKNHSTDNKYFNSRLSLMFSEGSILEEIIGHKSFFDIYVTTQPGKDLYLSMLDASLADLSDPNAFRQLQRHLHRHGRESQKSAEDTNDDQAEKVKYKRVAALESEYLLKLVTENKISEIVLDLSSDEGLRRSSELAVALKVFIRMQQSKELRRFVGQLLLKRKKKALEYLDQFLATAKGRTIDDQFAIELNLAINISEEFKINKAQKQKLSAFALPMLYDLAFKEGQISLVGVYNKLISGLLASDQKLILNSQQRDGLLAILTIEDDLGVATDEEIKNAQKKLDDIFSKMSWADIYALGERPLTGNEVLYNKALQAPKFIAFHDRVKKATLRIRQEHPEKPVKDFEDVTQDIEDGISILFDSHEHIFFLRNILKRSVRFKASVLHQLSKSSSRPRIVQELTISEIRKYIARLKQELRITKVKAKNLLGGPVTTLGYEDYINIELSKDAALMLYDAFFIHQSSISDFSVWAKTLKSIYGLNSEVRLARSEYQPALERRFLEFASQNLDVALGYLSRGEFDVFTGSSTYVDVLMVKTKIELAAASKPQDIKSYVDKINEHYELKTKQPEVFLKFREQIAEDYKFQPHNVEEILPEEKKAITTDSTKEHSTVIRGASGVARYSRSLKVHDQIELIEFMMGRSDDLPQFVIESEKKVASSFSDVLLAAKRDLKPRTVIERAFLINSMITGPGGPLSDAVKKQAYVDHLLKGTQRKDIAFEIATALLQSLGLDQSVFISFILAQKNDVTGKKLDEGQIIRALFEGFGAAGVKLGQYLAFTGELGAYSDVLSELQDSAMPISYLQAIRLLRAKLGDQWQQSWTVKKIIGSGSVNVAIEIFVTNEQSGESRVISVLREDIQTATRENFRKLGLFIDQLVKNELQIKNSAENYGYLPGLLKVIERQVNLEFDKTTALQVQKWAGVRYNRKISGWQFGSATPHALINDALVMEKAEGITARKIRQKNPKVYNEVMAHILKMEIEHLLAKPGDANYNQVPYFANPDFHDGQVLIDIEKRSVKIIDFGQALPITEDERDHALEILRVIAGADDSPSEIGATMSRLQMKLGLGGTSSLSSTEIGEIISRKDRMDRFVYILGITATRGWDIPLATINWIMGMNRMIQLGHNVGVNIENEIHDVLATLKYGGSLEIYHALVSRVMKMIYWGHAICSKYLMIAPSKALGQVININEKHKVAN